MPYQNLRKGRFSQEGGIYFVTAATFNRIPYFQDFFIARKLVSVMQEIEYTGQVGFLAWVIMPDHAHWLLQTIGSNKLSNVIKSLTGKSARIINQQLNIHGQFWQSNFYDHAIREEQDLKQIARYIVANPLRANLVDSIGDYPHWDARWI